MTNIPPTTMDVVRAAQKVIDAGENGIILGYLDRFLENLAFTQAVFYHRSEGYKPVEYGKLTLNDMEVMLIAYGIDVSLNSDPQAVIVSARDYFEKKLHEELRGLQGWVDTP